MQFNELNLCDEILKAVDELGFTEATEIQAQAIPPMIGGRDVIGLSSTGTGKTAAFGIPAVQMANENTDKATVLILCPTRELAVQSAGEIRKFSKYLQGVSSAVLYGGAPMENQIYQLKTARIVIGTPGRVMDHLRRRTLKLQNLRTIVLDEADEMLNMGFVDDIRTILESAPETRQTVLFSATMPPAIIKITEDFQTDPVKIKVHTGQKTAASIAQSFYNIPQAGKLDALKLLIEYHKPKRSLVFCNTKKMTDELCESLCDSGFRASALHGDLKQTQRNAVMKDFKFGRTNILIATDVAARGIDVDDVEGVFNYDIPQEYEYYIHRIGRTGRAGRAGASYTLASNRNQVMRVREIERYIGAPIIETPVPTLESIAENRMKKFADEILELAQAGAGTHWVTFIEELTEQGVDAVTIAAALCEKAHSKTNRLASVRNVISSNNKKIHAAGEGRAWLRADIGSNAKIGPNFIVGAITEATGMPSKAVGKINIFAEHTDIDVAITDVNAILEAMKGVRIKGQDVHLTKVNVSSKGSDSYSGGSSGRKRFNQRGSNGMHGGNKGGSGSYKGKSGGSYRGKGEGSYKGNSEGSYKGKSGSKDGNYSGRRSSKSRHSD